LWEEEGTNMTFYLQIWSWHMTTFVVLIGSLNSTSALRFAALAHLVTGTQRLWLLRPVARQTAAAIRGAGHQMCVSLDIGPHVASRPPTQAHEAAKRKSANCVQASNAWLVIERARYWEVVTAHAPHQVAATHLPLRVVQRQLIGVTPGLVLGQWWGGDVIAQQRTVASVLTIAHHLYFIPLICIVKNSCVMWIYN
jgi:hypothetical protein